MNSHVQHLFEIQTDILLNYCLCKFITFFMNPMQTKIHLYDAISPAREFTRHELSEANKEVPTTIKYELYAEKINSKLSVKLHVDNLSDIEIYNVMIPEERPSISFLKNIIKVVMYKYRPLPTKVHRQFSAMSKKYSDYLKFYEVKRSWQNGYISIKKVYIRDAKKEDFDFINSFYPDFLKDALELKNTYRAFTKIMIDIYHNKSKKEYSDKDCINTITVSYTHKHGVSLVEYNSIDRTSFNHLLPLDDFEPNNSYFADNHQICSTITKCVNYTLSQKD